MLRSLLISITIPQTPLLLVVIPRRLPFWFISRNTYTCQAGQKIWLILLNISALQEGRMWLLAFFFSPVKITIHVWIFHSGAEISTPGSSFLIVLWALLIGIHCSWLNLPEHSERRWSWMLTAIGYAHYTFCYQGKDAISVTKCPISIKTEERERERDFWGGSKSAWAFLSEHFNWACLLFSINEQRTAGCEQSSVIFFF